MWSDFHELREDTLHFIETFFAVKSRCQHHALGDVSTVLQFYRPYRTYNILKSLSSFWLPCLFKDNNDYDTLHWCRWIFLSSLVSESWGSNHHVKCILFSISKLVSFWGWVWNIVFSFLFDKSMSLLGNWSDLVTSSIDISVIILIWCCVHKVSQCGVCRCCQLLHYKYRRILVSNNVHPEHISSWTQPFLKSHP